MRTSQKMVLSLVFLAAFTLFYWEKIHQNPRWASEAMSVASTSTTMKVTSRRLLPKRVFCYGDSLTAGTSPPTHHLYPYGPYLEEALTKSSDSEISVKWKGFPGWTSISLLQDAGFSDMLETAKRDRNKILEESNPIEEELPPFDLVIILAGTNDLAHGYTSDEIFESVTGIHELALQKGCPKTLALGIPPSGWQAHSKDARTLAASVNQKLEAWVAYKQQSTAATSYYLPFPIETFDRSSDLWSPDTLHFSEAGYRYLGTELAPTVAEILSTDE